MNALVGIFLLVIAFLFVQAAVFHRSKKDELKQEQRYLKDLDIKMSQDGYVVSAYRQSCCTSNMYAVVSIQDKIAELGALVQQKGLYTSVILQSQMKMQNFADMFYVLKKSMDIADEVELYVIGGTGVLSGITATQENILYDPYDRRIYISGCYVNYHEVVQGDKLIQELYKVQTHERIGLKKI